MVKIDVEVLKNRVADAYDSVDLLDILDISVYELLDAFEDKLVAKRSEFSDLENIDEEEEAE